MENLTYQAYLANPRIREQLDREAHRARAEAVHQFIFAPLMRMAQQLFRRQGPKASRSIHVPA